jgi:putative ABC transport system permease protein
VRERRTEMGVLKTIGFTSAKVMGLVLAEAALLGAIGGAIGIFFSLGMIRALPYLPFIGDAVRGISDFGLPRAVGLTGFSLALGIGIIAGLAPAVAAYRARITDLLRQV